MSVSSPTESLDAKTIIVKIEAIHQHLQMWREKELDAITEYDRLRQDLLYFEDKLSLIQGKTTSENI